MLRLALRLALYGVLGFGAAALLIHARPVDDAPLRALLLPPDCPAPCLLGIQPGITTMREARDQLSQHPWIASAEPSSGFIDLYWNGSQPAFINTSPPSYIWGDAVVERVRIYTRLPLAEIQLLLGLPPAGAIRRTTTPRGMRHNIFYPRLGLEVSSFAVCPVQAAAIWRSPVVLQVDRRPVRYADYSYTTVTLARAFYCG